jgi:DNA-binding CsgD family transcriptional regulator
MRPKAMWGAKKASLAKLAESTADALFATTQKGEICAWNDAAESLLGYRREQALGQLCCKLLGGTDVFGNPFCDTQCPTRRAASRGDPLRPFQLDMRRADGTLVRVRLSVLLMPGRNRGESVLVHVLVPCPEQQPATAMESAARPAIPNAGLSQRELEVLQLLADGHSTAEIARKLFVAATTVRNHIEHILVKLDAHTRLGAVAIARRSGILRSVLPLTAAAVSSALCF